jgi:hypothetical protein
MTEKEQKQSNIEVQQQKQFLDMVQQGLREGGIHLNASKGFGKTRLLFSMAQSIRNLENTRVFVFDGSMAWLYGFSKIPVFNVNEEDIQLSEVKSIEDIETYSLTNWQLVNLALETHKDLLFRLKTRKPSKRGFFIRTVINYLDAQQRIEIDHNSNHEPKQSIAHFIEESQDAFNSRSQTRLESEEFLTVFNEARNNRESFFTASQRLNDFSKTIRTKQIYCLGRINSEDLTPVLRRLEKEHSINFSKMPLRTWFYEGQTFVSPEWKQQGKPYQINRALRAKYNSQQTQKPQSLIERFKNWQKQKLINRQRQLRRQRLAQRYNEDPSVYDYEPETEETGESDLEEDLALLNESDDLW